MVEVDLSPYLLAYYNNNTSPLSPNMKRFKYLRKKKENGSSLMTLQIVLVKKN
jgi:hypothetical protein